MVTKGNRIGSGRTAEVWEWGEGKVLKQFKPGFDRGMIEWEYKMAKDVFEAGVPSPQVYELLETDEGMGIVFARVEGECLLDKLQKSPWVLKKAARTMAQLHARMHRSTAVGLPEQRVNLAGRIQDSETVTGLDLQPFLRYAEQLPVGQAICHGDFHPGNIMESNGEWMVLDWTTAETGHPGFDVARTLLLLRSPFRPPGMPAMVMKLSGWFNGIMEKTYVKEYRKLTGMTLSEMEEWLPVVAAARLRERVPGEREWLTALLNHWRKQLG
ncbi:aminoglycoside phosphotransferase family protein [Gorillibacterium sp. CAU 1737]|uniref:phosphotransferase family protein n=1 Tax=Gorillibacterium sp. CAU 1737 TaxID=3140362 RepID=UPI0032609A27